MSVYKEDAMMLDMIEEAQTTIDLNAKLDSAFMGPFYEVRGFDLDHLTSFQKGKVDELRAFCKENIKYAKVSNMNDTWTFNYCMDEGAFGWDVKIQKIGNRYLGLKVKPFSR